MKELYYKYFCTLPTTTDAACEYQYTVFTFVGVCILIGSAIMLGVAWARRRKNDQP